MDLGAYPTSARWAIHRWISCRVISETGVSPNRGSKCFLSMNRRCFWVEALYIASTDASHSRTSVLNSTRDRVGFLPLAVAASFWARTSDASRREMSPSRSNRNTRRVAPSGAISHSRQRIAHLCFANI